MVRGLIPVFCSVDPEKTEAFLSHFSQVRINALKRGPGEMPLPCISPGPPFDSVSKKKERAGVSPALSWLPPAGQQQSCCGKRYQDQCQVSEFALEHTSAPFWLVVLASGRPPGRCGSSPALSRG
jgi:hypothetical protein